MRDHLSNLGRVDHRPVARAPPPQLVLPAAAGLVLGTLLGTA
jgi:hypothetical protein